MSTRNPEDRTWPVLTLGLVLVGVGLRVVQFCIERALWFDEARNAVEILKSDWLRMLPPYAQQPTSSGFLVVERLFVSALGDSEWALRLFPLLTGVGAVLLGAIVARRVLQGVAIPIAVAFIALSGPAIYFSTEVKAYSSDLFFALALAWAILHVDDRDEVSALDVVGLSLLGSVAVWISYTSIFVLAAGGVLLLASRLRDRDLRSAFRVCFIGAVWLANFGAYYALVISHWPGADWLPQHWADSFPAADLGGWGLLAWGSEALRASFRETLGIGIAAVQGAPVVEPLAAIAETASTWIDDLSGEPNWRSAGHDLLQWGPGVCLAFFLAGLVRALVRGQGRILFFMGIVALTLLAGVLHLYPYQGRLLLFLVPALAFGVAHGAEGLLGRGRRSWVLVAVLAVAFAGPVWNATRLVTMAQPLHRHGTANIRSFEGLRWVVSYIERHRQPGDIVYVYYFAEPQYRYYAHRFGLTAPAIFGVRSPDDPRGYLEDLEQLRGGKHVWVVFGHALPAEQRLIVQRLDEMGKRLDELQRPRATAYLYDFSSGKPAR